MKLDQRWWLVAAVLPFMGFWAYGLTDLDEGFYGAVVTDMIRRGDWITPTYNGSPWFEKPILAYWLAIPSVMAFGNEFGARLPSFVCTLATVWTWHRFARRHLPGAEIVLPLAYAGSLLVTGVGRMMMTDAALTLFLTLALHGLYRSLTEGTPKLAVGIWLGLAVLAKGPVALVLFVGAGLVLAWKAPAWRQGLQGGWLAPGLATLAIVALWFVPCYLVNREVFVQDFLVTQNLGRFAGGDKAHATPLWAAPFYFPLVLMLALLPLSATALREFLGGLRGSWSSAVPGVETFLIAWAGTVLVFFSVSGTKLHHYILPAVGPFCALLVVAAIRQGGASRMEAPLAGWCATVGALAVCVFSTVDRLQFQSVRQVALAAAARAEPVATVGLSGERPTAPSLKLTEQASPSIGFYLRRTFLEAANLRELSARGFTGLVIIRSGRVGGGDLMDAYLRGQKLEQLDPKGSSYELWRLSDQGAR